MASTSIQNATGPTRRTVLGMIGAVLAPLGFLNGTKLLACVVPEEDDKRAAPPQLRFQIIADRRRHETEMSLAERQWPKKKIGAEKNVVAEFVPYGRWVPTTKAREMERGAKFDWLKPPKTFSIDDSLRFVPVANIEGYYASAESSYLVRTHDGKKYVLAAYDSDGMRFFAPENLIQIDPHTGVHYVLVYNDKWNVVGEDLTEAEKFPDENSKLIVCFKFNAAGAAKFARLTGEFSPDRDGKKYMLGVVFNGRLRSAANLIAKISSGAATISGMQPEEADALIKVLGKFRKEPPRVKAPGTVASS